MGVWIHTQEILPGQDKIKLLVMYERIFTNIQSQGCICNIKMHMYNTDRLTLLEAEIRTDHKDIWTVR